MIPISLKYSDFENKQPHLLYTLYLRSEFIGMNEIPVNYPPGAIFPCFQGRRAAIRRRDSEFYWLSKLRFRYLDFTPHPRPLPKWKITFGEGRRPECTSRHLSIGALPMGMAGWGSCLGAVRSGAGSLNLLVIKIEISIPVYTQSALCAFRLLYLLGRKAHQTGSFLMGFFRCLDQGWILAM